MTGDHRQHDVEAKQTIAPRLVFPVFVVLPIISTQNAEVGVFHQPHYFKATANYLACSKMLK